MENNNYLTVNALTKYIKYKFDNDRHLLEVLLEGEISNFKHHSRGHFYFTLKDDYASISAIMFARDARNVLFEPKEGMKVFVKGRISVYEPTGNYQIYVTEMKSDGVGDLYLQFLKLKEELDKQGLFLPDHKVSIPRFPKTIGVVTAETGAAVRDIINTITRRWPLCKIILYPTLVQGVYAKDSIVSQIEQANKDALCDVLLVGRGGGSIEDLWAFNEKIVAYAIYNSTIPIISGVGHEIDFTISDFVADMRAATPTAAAELATPNIDTMKEYFLEYQVKLNKEIRTFFENKKMRLVNLDRQIEAKNPKNILDMKKEKLKYLLHRLNVNMNQILDNKKNIYQMLNQHLTLSNPLSIMDKGYSVVKHNDTFVKSITDVSLGDKLEIRVKDGFIISTVEETQDERKK